MPHHEGTTPEGLIAELDKVHEHIKAFKEYGEPLPQKLIEKLQQIREDAQAAMHAAE